MGRGGRILVRSDICIACGACADGCSFGMVTMHPTMGLPLICDLLTKSTWIWML